jgi:hypothetical protein
MLPVVVGTHPERKAWLDDCLASIRATTWRRPIHVHRTGGYEPAAIRTGCATFPRFLYLQDSVTILHPDFWTAIDASGPAWLAGWPPMFLAIYDSAAVEPHLPTHEVSKVESTHLEGSLPSVLPMPTLWPDVIDANHLRREDRHGRDNLVLGNHLFEKHKGTWS